MSEKNNVISPELWAPLEQEEKNADKIINITIKISIAITTGVFIIYFLLLLTILF